MKLATLFVEYYRICIRFESYVFVFLEMFDVEVSTSISNLLFFQQNLMLQTLFKSQRHRSSILASTFSAYFTTSSTTTTNTTDADYKSMSHAIECARNSIRYQDVPVGAIIVRNKDGLVLGEGYNKRERDKSAIAHAEIVAIQRASEITQDWKLDKEGDCTMYVTLEPCLMCYTACSHARISRIVYAAEQDGTRTKGTTSTSDVVKNIKLNYMPKLEYMERTESSSMLKTFFKQLRNKKV